MSFMSIAKLLLVKTQAKKKESRRADSNRFPAHYERYSIAEGTALRRRLLAVYAFDNITSQEPASVREARNRSLGWLVDGEQDRGIVFL
jgi:hypothetical protein